MILLVGPARWEEEAFRLLTDRTSLSPRQVICSNRDDISRFRGTKSYIYIIVDDWAMRKATYRMGEMLEFAEQMNRMNGYDERLYEDRRRVRNDPPRTTWKNTPPAKTIDLGECVAVPIREEKVTVTYGQRIDGYEDGDRSRPGHYDERGRWIRNGAYSATD